VRLGIAFATGPEIWVSMQAQRDLWVASQQEKPKVKRLAA